MDGFDFWIGYFRGVSVIFRVVFVRNLHEYSTFKDYVVFITHFIYKNK